MPNGESTAGPEGAAKALAGAKAALSETHKHFGDNPDYAPKAPQVNNESAQPSYKVVQAARKPATTLDELDVKKQNVDQYKTQYGDK